MTDAVTNKRKRKILRGDFSPKLILKMKIFCLFKFSYVMNSNVNACTTEFCLPDIIPHCVGHIVDSLLSVT